MDPIDLSPIYEKRMDARQQDASSNGLDENLIAYWNVAPLHIPSPGEKRHEKITSPLAHDLRTCPQLVIWFCKSAAKPDYLEYLDFLVIPLIETSSASSADLDSKSTS